jgi:hypothetical protein
VEEYNRLYPAEEPLVDPSSDCIASDVTLLLLTWYRLFCRCDPPKDEEDINELQELAHWYLKLSKNIWIYLNLSKFPWSYFLTAGVVFDSYFEKCTEVFPHENLLGFNIMHNQKNHSLKHGGGDIAKYGDPINMSCDAPEDGHKFWVKDPGGNTHQGPEIYLNLFCLI